MDIDAYRGGSIVGNLCMYLATNGNQIMDAMSKAMLPEMKDVNNRKYLGNINLQMKYILELWYT